MKYMATGKKTTQWNWYFLMKILELLEVWTVDISQLQEKVPDNN